MSKFLHKISPVSDVEHGEQVVEAFASHILGVQDHNAEDVSDKAKNTRAFNDKFELKKQNTFDSPIVRIPIAKENCNNEVNM